MNKPAPPPPKLIRLAAVEAMTGLKRSSIYAAMRTDTFPKSIQLSARSVAWKEHEIIEWCASKKTAKIHQREALSIPPSTRVRTTKNGWIAVGRRVEHVDDSIPDICSCAPEDFGQDGRSDKECCANARLIAQSLPMLESLRELLWYSEQESVDFGNMLDAMARARVVISNATGGTP